MITRPCRTYQEQLKAVATRWFCCDSAKRDLTGYITIDQGLLEGLADSWLPLGLMIVYDRYTL